MVSMGGGNGQFIERSPYPAVFPSSPATPSSSEQYLRERWLRQRPLVPGRGGPCCRVPWPDRCPSPPPAPSAPGLVDPARPPLVWEWCRRIWRRDDPRETHRRSRPPPDERARHVSPAPIRGHEVGVWRRTSAGSSLEI